MRNLVRLFLISTLALGAAACDRQEVPRPDAVDPLAYLDTMNFAAPALVSPLEAGVAEEPVAEEKTQKTVSKARSSGTRTSSSSARRSSSGTYSAPAPVQTETVRHTARDAAIGAGAGAVIGAVAGGRNNRVKGAIIGGAAGAVIGGVIGHTVDTDTRVKRN